MLVNPCLVVTVLNENQTIIDRSVFPFNPLQTDNSVIRWGRTWAMHIPLEQLSPKSVIMIRLMAGKEASSKDDASVTGTQLLVEAGWAVCTIKPSISSAKVKLHFVSGTNSVFPQPQGEKCATLDATLFLSRLCSTYGLTALGTRTPSIARPSSGQSEVQAELQSQLLTKTLAVSSTAVLEPPTKVPALESSESTPDLQITSLRLVKTEDYVEGTPFETFRMTIPERIAAGQFILNLGGRVGRTLLVPKDCAKGETILVVCSAK